MEIQKNMLSKDKRELYKVNPLIKIIILLVITIVVSIDKYPFLSILLIIFLFLIVNFLSEISILSFIYKIRIIFMISVIYTTFILLGQRISRGNIDLMYSIALGLRFIVIGGYSLIFINTVNPKEMVMSIIKYLKIKYEYGFAFLSAYRFFPTFSEELEKIKFSHTTRGLSSDGILNSVKNMRSYLIPLLVTSIRNGIKISTSMESRGFGKFKERNNYNDIEIRKKDIYYLIVFFILLIAAIFALVSINLFRFSLIY